MSEFKGALKRGLKTLHENLPYVEQKYNELLSDKNPFGPLGNVAVHGAFALADLLLPKLIGSGLSKDKIKAILKGHMDDSAIEMAMAKHARGGAKIKPGRLSKY